MSGDADSISYLNLVFERRTSTLFLVEVVSKILFSSEKRDSGNRRVGQGRVVVRVELGLMSKVD